ncbi:hypothetical protein K501DRAFT_302375 [Backusella circina FSU 941]|nr:hypothetical protein K501DRAFT_302375 [Backusella circina FSU 941]
MNRFNTDYFYTTPAKKWKLIDAIDYFDKLKPYDSFYEILLDLSTALNKVKETQASFKKYVNDMEEELMKLLKLNIYTREAPLDNQENIAPIAQGVSNTTQNLPAETKENSNIEKLSDVLNNHGQINVRPNHVTFTSNKTLGKRQADQINDGDPTLTNPLPRNATLWTKNVDNLDRRSYIFLDIVRYTLCSFNLVAKTVPEYMSNHERTYFIENIIPSMLSLAKNTGFIEFKWYGRKKCETEFHSTKTLNLADYDYDLRGAPASKNIDALGILSTQSNMELVVVESSRFVEDIGMWSGIIKKTGY